MALELGVAVAEGIADPLLLVKISIFVWETGGSRLGHIGTREWDEGGKARKLSQTEILALGR